MVIPLLVTEAGKAQAALLVSTQVTTSLLLSVVVVKVALLVPALLPFTFHWYAGVLPPLVGVAVKATLLPLHTVVACVVIDTAGTIAGVTVINSALLLAVGLLTQAALLVSWQVTISLFASVAVE
jgi:hypothetical protein